MSIAVVWFRRDLRLQDNPALDAALRAHERVLCAYIHAPHEEAPWQPGAASRSWLHHSLRSLDADLSQRSARLLVRRGDTQNELFALLHASGADSIYWNRLHEPALAARDSAVEQSLRDAGVAVHS